MASEKQRGGWRRHKLLIGGVVLLVLLLLLLSALRPSAPRRLDILTGPEGSSYLGAGERIAAALRKEGIHVRVVETKGALDNLGRLAVSDTPTVAFVQSRVEKTYDGDASLDHLVSLGSLAFEPVWLIVPEDSPVERVADLAGKSVILGPEGSGSRELATLLLDLNGILDDVNSAPFDAMEDDEGIAAMKAGTLDAIFATGAAEAPLIAGIIQTPGLGPIPLPRTDAYVALNPGLARFHVPRGAFNLRLDKPEADFQTVAATTNLVTTDDLHGAMIDVLLDTARNTSWDVGLEVPEGKFPSKHYVSLPLSPRARQFYDQGPSKWARSLPYWLFAIVDQIVFVVVPALAIVFAVLKVLPVAITLNYTLKSLRISRRMFDVERALVAGADPQTLWKQLQELDEESAVLRVPITKSGEYLELRQNIHDTRERVVARHGGEVPDLPDDG